MANFTDNSSHAARWRRETGSNIRRSESSSQFGEKHKDIFSSVPAIGGSAALDLPVPLKGSHTAVLHDTGAGCALLSAADEERAGAARFEPEDFIRQSSDTYFRLPHSVLVRLKLARKESEAISILCSAREIGYRGVRLSLPCQLGLQPGTLVNMDLFLHQESPISVSGRIRKLSRSESEDIVRYVLVVDFHHTSGPAEREIAAFVDEAQIKDTRQMLT